MKFQLRNENVFKSKMIYLVCVSPPVSWVGPRPPSVHVEWVAPWPPCSAPAAAPAGAPSLSLLAWGGWGSGGQEGRRTGGQEGRTTHVRGRQRTPPP